MPGINDQAHSKAIALVVAVALTLTACSGSNTGSGQGTPSNPTTTQTDAATKSFDGGLIVHAAPGALAGSGTIEAHQVPATDTYPGLHPAGPGWQITATNLSIKQPLTLTLPVPQAGNGPPPLVMTRETASDPWQPIAGQWSADHTSVQVTTTHLSFWNVWTIDQPALTTQATGTFTDLFSHLAGQPSCTGTSQATQAGWSVSTDTGDRLRWCLGYEQGRAVLRVSNGRGYPQEFTYPDTWTLDPPPSTVSIESAGTQLVARVMIAAKGRKVTVLGRGATLTLHPPTSPAGVAQIAARPSGAANLVGAFDYGLETLQLVVSKVPGVAGTFSTSERVVEKVLTTRSCVEAAQTVAGQAPENAAQAWDTFKATIGLGFGCLTDAWGQAYGDQGVLGAFALGVLTWLESGALYEVNTIQGIVESFGYGMFVITVHPPATAATAIVRIDPFAPDGTLRSPYTVDMSRAGSAVDCSYDRGSATALTGGTHDCGASADSANACWASPRYPGLLLCLPSAWSTVLYAHAFGPLRVTTAPADPQPLGIETADGSRFEIRVGGSWGGRADGYGGAYSCQSGNACGPSPAQHTIAVLTNGTAPAVNRTHQPWTVLVGELGDPGHRYPAPQSLTVAKAYFIVNSIRA